MNSLLQNQEQQIVANLKIQVSSTQGNQLGQPSHLVLYDQKTGQVKGQWAACSFI